MADATQIVVDQLNELLRRRARETMLVITGSEDLVVKAANEAIATILRLSSEVERLTPKPMTPERIAETFNDHGVMGFWDWIVDQHGTAVGGVSDNSRSFDECPRFHWRVAQYIALGILAEKEAARG